MKNTLIIIGIILCVTTQGQSMEQDFNLRKAYLSYCKAVPDTIGLRFITYESGSSTTYLEVFNRKYRSQLHDEPIVMFVRPEFFWYGEKEVWIIFKAQYIREYSKHNRNITDYIRAEPITRAQEPTFEGYTKWLEKRFDLTLTNH